MNLVSSSMGEKTTGQVHKPVLLSYIKKNALIS
jgi:hypothetical protein